MIFSAFERMVAMRYLRARRQEGFISVIALFSLLGIGLGVATLIIVMAVMNGFRAELQGRILGLNGHVNVYSLTGEPIAEPDDVVARLQSVPGVLAVMPGIEAQALLTVRGSANGVIVRALRPEDFAVRPVLAENIIVGEAAAVTGEGVAIGVRMAQRYGLALGDRITVLSPRGTPTAFGTAPRQRAFTIVAMFDVGMFEYDSNFIYMALDTAQLFFRVDGVTGIEVLVENPDDLARLRRDIAAATGPGFRVVDWQQVNASFFNALQVERNVMFLILSLIIMVAAFNIISSLIMLVKDKGRDIAILRTMGATRGMIMRVFFLSGASVGVIGTVAGVALGVAFALNIETIRQWLQGLTGTELFSAEIYFLSRLPAKLVWAEVIQVVVMALGLSFAATLYPSWRAARLDPVEALRYE